MSHVAVENAHALEQQVSPPLRWELARGSAAGTHFSLLPPSEGLRVRSKRLLGVRDQTRNDAGTSRRPLCGIQTTGSGRSGGFTDVQPKLRRNERLTGTPQCRRTLRVDKCNAPMAGPRREDETKLRRFPSQHQTTV